MDWKRMKWLPVGGGALLCAGPGLLLRRRRCAVAAHSHRAGCGAEREIAYRLAKRRRATGRSSAAAGAAAPAVGLRRC